MTAAQKFGALYLKTHGTSMLASAPEPARCVGYVDDSRTSVSQTMRELKEMSTPLPHRLTIDVNIVRDFLDSRRYGHKLATELFSRNGSDIDLAVAAQGHRLDATGLLGGELREALAREGIDETRQLAYLSEATYPSEDLFPGQYVDGFKEAWKQIIDTWKTDQGRAPASPDDFHVEAHVLDGRDFFVTGDCALRAMCRRLHDEHQIPVVAMTVGMYFEFRSEAA